MPGLTQARIGSVPVWHLGPLDAPRALVIIGRANRRKPSDLLNTLAVGLHGQCGLTLVWFASRRSNTMGELIVAFGQMFDGALARWCEHGGLAGRILRKLTFCALLLARPSRWSFLPALMHFTSAGSARDLRRFIRALPTREVVLLGHSAGAHIASLAANEPRVSRVIGLGYPFRHPSRAEEPGRTAHLADMAKPLLILQGQADAYGSAADARRYRLSPAVTVFSIPADHDYARLPPEDLRGCADLLASFASAPVPTPVPASAPVQTGQAAPAGAAAAILRSRP